MPVRQHAIPNYIYIKYLNVSSEYFKTLIAAIYNLR
jgi:hypothetical protein